MAVRFLAPSQDFYSTTLNGSINSTQTTSITLNSVTNLQAPGVIIVDRLTAAGAANPTGRELISFTSISGSVLAGTVTRGYYGTARSHNDAAVVESVVDAGIWNSLTSQIDMAMDTDGYLKAIASPASISQMNTAQLVTVSQASIYQLGIRQALNASGASITGVWPHAVAVRFSGAFSGASTFLAPPIQMPTGGNWQWWSIITRTVASGVSAIVDVNSNGTSIFAAVGRPMIAAGGTMASTASIATKAFNPGDKITFDYDGTGGMIQDLLIEGFYTQ